MLPANSLLLFCCLWNWYVLSLIIALCAVLVLHHQNSIGDLTSVLRNHNLESFHILAWLSSPGKDTCFVDYCNKLEWWWWWWLPIFLQCIVLAHQAALYIQLSMSIEVINNNQKPYWLNEWKYLWNVLMCPLCCTRWNWVLLGLLTVLQNAAICALDFKSFFKLVDILSSGRETPCAQTWTVTSWGDWDRPAADVRGAGLRHSLIVSRSRCRWRPNLVSLDDLRRNENRGDLGIGSETG